MTSRSHSDFSAEKLPRVDNDDAGVKKVMACTDAKVKERRCLVIDPSKQDVRLKLHWMLHKVPDEDIRT